jgi:hypothetical protein
MTQSFSHKLPYQNGADSLRQYLSSLYAPALEICNDARLALWAKRGDRKLVFASRDVELIVQKALAWSSAKWNVFLHTSLHRLAEGEGRGYRGKIETAAVAVGVFADIDAQGPERKKPPELLCPTVADAIELPKRFNVLFEPLQVSLLVASGHGCYAGLIFRAPLLLETAEDLKYLDSLSRRFHYVLQSIADEHGWTDAVDLCDTAKVLRLPAAVNWKSPAQPKVVELVGMNEAARFTPLECDEVLPVLPNVGDAQHISSNGAAPAWVTGNTSPGTVVAAGSLVIRADAQPPQAKLTALFEHVPEFVERWNHRGRQRDQSQSGWDMGIAHHIVALTTDWTDQEIADALIANARQFGREAKRADYYARTIAKARRSTGEIAPVHGLPAVAEGEPAVDPEEQQEQAKGEQQEQGQDGQKQAEEQEEPHDEERKKSITEDADVAAEAARRRTCLELVSAKLWFKILRILKYLGEPAEYRIETAQGVIKVDTATLITQKRLRVAVAEVVGRYIPEFPQHAWRAPAQLLLAACEFVDRGQDATRNGEMAEWLRSYLEAKMIHDTLEESDPGREPFWSNGYCCIYVENFKEWLHLRKSQRLTHGELTARLRDFEAEPVTDRHVVINNKETSRSYWRLPAGDWIPYK